jgi:hypothetical protein
VADCSKHIIQIVQLLEERSMSFSFCLNKNEMLTLCGLSLLYQRLDLKQEGKLMQDGQRLVTIVIRYLEKADAPRASDFRRLASSMMDLRFLSPPVQSSGSSMAAPKTAKSIPSPTVSKPQIRSQVMRHTSASISETDLLSQQEKLRRATLPNFNMQRPDHYSPRARSSIDSIRSDSSLSKRDYRVPQFPTNLKPRPNPVVKSEKPPNLDYLSLSNTPASSHPPSPHTTRQHAPIYNQYKQTTASQNEWEALLGSMDSGQTNLYDAIYGGPALSLTESSISQSNYGDWSPESVAWDMSSMGMGDMGEFHGAGSGVARSVLSFSEESLSSGEEFGDYSNPNLGLMRVQSGESYLLEGLDAGLGL